MLKSCPYILSVNIFHVSALSYLLCANETSEQGDNIPLHS